MASKNLKAVCVRGNGGVSADMLDSPAEFMGAVAAGKVLGRSGQITASQFGALKKVAADGSDFTVHGWQDLDGDGVPAHWIATRTSNPVLVSDPGVR